MILGIPKETVADETRVAAVPETVRKLIAMGIQVQVEKDAGAAASIPDQAFADAGASLVSGKSALAADIIFKVRPPSAGEIAGMKKGATIISLMEPYGKSDTAAQLEARGVTGFALELVPRITRAQSMDVLSSQSNLAGYRAVLEAADAYGRSFPMMMTAAGTVPPAKVLVMGAGVAGLQAIATAKRLGAVVSATDVRPAVKEQVESLGGKFVAVEDEEFKAAETAGGYAKEMSQAYQQKQAALIAETIKSMDIVITTALIPGRPAPVLVSEAMLKEMKAGSVIVDLAAGQGGNCPLTEKDKIVTRHGVTLIGHSNMPARLPEIASSLFARNLLNFLGNIWDSEASALAIDSSDEIVNGSMMQAVKQPAKTKAKTPKPANPAKTAKKKAAKKTARKAGSKPASRSKTKSGDA